MISALRDNGHAFLHVIATGQHRLLFDQVAENGLTPDVDLGLMQAGGSTARFLGRAALGLHDALSHADPALVVVQGDTASAYAGALAAFRLGIPIAHVEAGLRTASIAAPFPEELFRRAIARLATIHFAPTLRARDALLCEGISGASIHVTGNTGIDSLFERLARRQTSTPTATALIDAVKQGPFGLVTVHRGENRGRRLNAIATGLKRVAEALSLPLILPLHPSPALYPLDAALRPHALIHIVPPLDHDSMIGLLERAVLVLTDSGGLQEEAAALGTPMVVLRNETERVEAVEAGRAALAGANAEAILDAADAMLAHGRFPRSDLFGDGNASVRIAAIIGEWLRR